MPLSQIRQFLDNYEGVGANEFLGRIATQLSQEDQAKLVKELGIAVRTFTVKREAQAAVLRKIAVFRAMTPSHHYCQRLLQ